jgi:hypothetical protein
MSETSATRGIAQPLPSHFGRGRMLELAVKSLSADQSLTTEQIIERARAFDDFVYSNGPKEPRQD